MEGVHYANFLRATGQLQAGDHEGAGFSDGDLYKWLEAAVATYNVTRDPKLESLIDQVITVIGRVQQSDGYIFTRLTLEKRRGRTDARPFENAIDFETYNCGHLMTAACLHYKVTTKRSLLDIAVKLSDFLCGAFANPTPDLARFDICPSHYMGIVEMYRTTGDPRYLELGKKFIDMRDLVENGGDQNQERQPFLKQTKGGWPCGKSELPLRRRSRCLFGDWGRDSSLSAERDLGRPSLPQNLHHRRHGRAEYRHLSEYVRQGLHARTGSQRRPPIRS